MDATKKAPVLGIILFVLGVILFFVITPATFVLVFPTFILLMLGWGLTFASAVRRGSSGLTATSVILLLLLTVSLFYLLMDHTIHVASGIGFGMPHEPPTGHVMLGLIMLIITMALTSVIALRKPSLTAKTMQA